MCESQLLPEKQKSKTEWKRKVNYRKKAGVSLGVTRATKRLSTSLLLILAAAVCESIHIQGFQGHAAGKCGKDLTWNVDCCWFLCDLNQRELSNTWPQSLWTWVHSGDTVTNCMEGFMETCLKETKTPRRQVHPSIFCPWSLSNNLNYRW